MCGVAQKKAWVYDSASDAEYWAEHYLKNMPNLVSIDGFVYEEEIPDGYEYFRVDGDDAGCPLKKETCVDCEYDNGMVCGFSVKAPACLDDGFVYDRRDVGGLD